MRLKALVITLLLLCPACGGSSDWNDSHKTNFLRACRREAGYEKQDLCTPLAMEIENRINQGASKTCLLFSGNDIAVADDPTQRAEAQERFDSC